MNIHNKIILVKRVDALIRRKSTGSPKELANKLEISESNVYRLINLMKELDGPIYYDEYRRSYCYEFEVDLSIGFLNKNNKKIKDD